MIKYKIETDTSHDGSSNISWVTKRKVTPKDSQSFIGLEFHKITPRIKESVKKNSCEDVY